jgi:hypothetical protein
MNTLAMFLRIEIWCIFGALLLIVSYQLATGKINMAGMLYEKGERTHLSPARVQLLVFTLANAFYLLLQVLESPQPHTFPKYSDALLVILGGSHVSYLASKTYALLFRHSMGADDRIGNWRRMS